VGADRRLVHAYGEGAGEHGVEDGWHWIPGNFSSRHIPCCCSSFFFVPASLYEIVDE
jgi:hypothetical protein